MGIQFYSKGNPILKPIRLSRDARNELYNNENWKAIELSEYEIQDEDGNHVIDVILLKNHLIRWNLIEGVLVTALSLARAQNADERPDKAIMEIDYMTQLSQFLSNLNFDAFTMDG